MSNISRNQQENVQKDVDYLLNYSHSRQDPFKKTSDDLFALIDKFGDQENILDYYKYCKEYYGLPENIVKKKFKNTFSNCYEYKKLEQNIP